VNRRRRPRWSSEDRQRFADGDRLRASTRPGRRRLPPAVEEWLDETGQLDDVLDDLGIDPNIDDT
jgi:hypothetical protein